MHARSIAIICLILWGGHPVLCAQGQTPSAATPASNRTTTFGGWSQRTKGEDWPRFLGPRGDSTSAESGIITDWSNNGLRVLWQLPLEESYGVCTVRHGRLFQFDRQKSQGVLICLEAETGRELWRFAYDYDYVDTYNYNRGPRTSPLVDDDRIYLYGVEGTLLCVDLQGQQIWRVDTNKQFGVVQNFFGVGSNPIVVGDLLIVMVGGSPKASRAVPPGQLDRVVGNGSAIVAFNKFTGEVVYQLSDELASYASLRLADVHGRAWCFAFCRGGLLAFDPSDGQQDFHFPWRAKTLESVNASVPVVFDDKVFLSETYGPGSALLRLEKSGDFQVVWQDDDKRRGKSMQTHWNTAVYHQGYLYGSSGRHERNAELRCIDALTGAVKWSEPGLSRSSLLLVDEHLVCLSEDGALRLLRATPEGYQEVTKFVEQTPNAPLLRYPAWAAPVLAHGLLLARGADRLVCFELIPEI